MEGGGEEGGSEGWREGRGTCNCFEKKLTCMYMA